MVTTCARLYPGTRCDNSHFHRQQPTALFVATCSSWTYWTVTACIGRVLKPGVVDVTGNAAAAMPTNTSLCLQWILTDEVYRATARCSAVTPTLSVHLGLYSACRVWTALVKTNERTNNNNMELSVISGFRLEVHDNCCLEGCYAASSANFLQTFRDNLSLPSSGSRPKRRQEITNTGPVTRN